MIESQYNFRSRSISLNTEQRKLVEMPFLDLKIQKRLKGVAGSGKSLVAGARVCFSNKR